MQYTYEIHKQVLIVHCNDNLITAIPAPSLTALVEDCLAQNVKHLAVNLSEVRFINSSGISLLMRLLTKFRTAGGDMVLINPSELIRKLLIITKLNAIFTIVGSVEEAVACLPGDACE